MTTNPPVLDQVIAFGVVPVIRTSTAALALTAVEWLHEAGFRTFEITLTIPGAAGVLRELSREADLLIGAGTAMSYGDVVSVTEAGARYVVAPCVVPDVGKACKDTGVVCMMGALSPTEVFEARQAGAHLVKIFPASTVGPGHLKALRSVFPDVLFMPTGGVDAKTLPDWIKAGASCVGVGGKLVDESLIKAGDKAAIIETGRALLEAYAALKPHG